MFIRENVFKKKIREAYKGLGLEVGITEDGIWMHIAGADWDISMDVNALTNKMKAALIEIIGSMPRPGKSILVQKDKDEDRIEEHCFGALENDFGMNREVDWEITFVLLTGTKDADVQILQRRGGILKTYIRNSTLRLVRLDSANGSEGTKLYGPKSAGEKAGCICFQDADTMLLIDTVWGEDIEVFANTLKAFDAARMEVMKLG